MVRPNLVLLSKRIPLIQFRKGGLAAASNKPGPSPQITGGAPIEDWQLPARFARKPIDPLEAEYINNGGVPN